jgi:poly(beta-D-mannuronate) C5 epimerase
LPVNFATTRQKGKAPELSMFAYLPFLVLIATAAADAPPSVANTNYPVPENAWFVAPNGNDTFSGTIKAPLRTISAAIDRAPSGTTILIRAGVYRESLGSRNKPLILQPYPHEKVWIKGSVEATNWVADPHGWRIDNWQPRFEQTSYDPGEITAEHPLAGKPEMVFVDGRPLQQVRRLNALQQGCFYVDNEKHALFIADDPHQKRIEATKFGHALELYRGASGSIIRGLGFAHYANVKHEGAVRALDGASDILFENNTFADNAGSPLLIYNCRNVILRNNTFLRAGYQGLSAWKTVGLTIETNQFVANNYEHFATDGDYGGAAGAKIFASSDVSARKNEFSANHCTGLWFDGSCHGCKVICNNFSNNERAGVHVEESAQVMVVGNKAERNGGAGIYVSNSSDVRVYNNLLVDNDPNVTVQDDSRVNSDAAERQKGIDYITARVQLFNNVLAIGRDRGPMLWVRDFNSVPRKSASEMIDGCDYNSWQHPDKPDATLVEWWGKSTSREFRDLQSFRAETGCESHGIEHSIDTGKSPVETATGRHLPADIAGELGRDSAAAVPIGKLECRP